MYFEFFYKNQDYNENCFLIKLLEQLDQMSENRGRPSMATPQARALLVVTRHPSFSWPPPPLWAKSVYSHPSSRTVTRQHSVWCLRLTSQGPRMCNQGWIGGGGWLGPQTSSMGLCSHFEGFLASLSKTALSNHTAGSQMVPGIKLHEKCQGDGWRRGSAKARKARPALRGPRGPSCRPVWDTPFLAQSNRYDP